MCYRSTASADQPSVQFVSAALRNQLQNGAIEVSYTYVHTERPDEADNYRYVRMQDKQYLEKRTHDGTICYQVFDATLDKGHYLSIKDDEKRGAVADGRERDELGYARLMDPVQILLPEGMLLDQMASGIVSSEKELVDGHECWRVEIAPDSKAPDHKYVVMVDPSIGFCPRRIEAYFTAGLSNVCVLSDYENIGNGIWYPMSMRLMPVYEGQPASAREVKVESIRLVDEQYVRSLQVDFPSGTVVRDLILDAVYTVS